MSCGLSSHGRLPYHMLLPLKQQLQINLTIYLISKRKLLVKNCIRNLFLKPKYKQAFCLDVQLVACNPNLPYLPLLLNIWVHSSHLLTHCRALKERDDCQMTMQINICCMQTKAIHAQWFLLPKFCPWCFTCLGCSLSMVLIHICRKEFYGSFIMPSGRWRKSYQIFIFF